MRQEIFPLTSPSTLPQDAAVLSAILENGISISAPLSVGTPQTNPKYVSEDFFNLSKLSSSEVNNFFTSISNDLARLFAASNYNDLKIHALERLGFDDLSSISQNLDRLQDKIKATADLQIGYNAGFTVYQRTNFISDVSIEKNLDLIGNTPAFYDAKSNEVTLALASSRDVLHSAQGKLLVDVQIDEQLGYPLSAYSKIRTPQHALDSNQTSYWGEVVLADSPIAITWPTPNSTYLPAATAGVIPYISGGALAEYTIKFSSPESFNTILIKPFSGLPINLAGIFVTKKTLAETTTGEYSISSLDNNFTIYSITEYDSARKNGFLFLDETTQLALPMQEDVISITLVFHQPHYTKEIFAVPTHDLKLRNLWQQMLGNSPGLGEASLDLTFISDPAEIISAVASSVGSNLVNTLVTTDTTMQNFVRYQYVYGAYSIDIYDRRYSDSAVFVSNNFNSGINLAQGTLIADISVPKEPTDIATTGWFGPTSLIPQSYSVPASTMSYDLSYGSSENWYPLASFDSATVSEALIIENPVSQFNLRLQAIPNTPIYISSFDGLGNVTLLGGIYAPTLVDDVTPTQVVLPSIELQGPGFYVVDYTPMDNSKVVDFAYFLGPEPASFQKSWVATPASSTQPLIADPLRGLQLPEAPYIAIEKIGTGFEPNGLPGREYVPLNVTIDNFPMDFTDPVSKATIKYNSYTQDTGHLTDLNVSVPVVGEILNSSDANPAAAQHFTTQYGKWDTTSVHFPQIYQLSQNGPQVVIPQIDSSGMAVWEFNPDLGTITFVNGNAAVSGQISISYWYYGAEYAKPTIVNRTDYISQIEPDLVPFDIRSYPIIEYVQVGDRLFFNINIPTTATLTVNYYRLYENMRMRATFTRVDPLNESSTPRLYGFTLLGRDANGTSDVTRENPEVTWSDIQYYPLGSNVQINPLRNLVNIDEQGNQTFLDTSLASSQVPPQVPAGLVLNPLTEFHWYRVVNSGSNTDYLRAQYYSGAGTSVYVDLTGSQFIEPDAGLTMGINYMILAADGSNGFTLNPGASVLIAIGNPRKAPGVMQAIDPAVIYSAQTPNYLQSQSWLFAASLPGKDYSAVEFTIS